MKKILLSIIISALLISYSNAQFISAGIKAGGQFNNVTYDTDLISKTEGVFGYHGGAFLKVKSPVKLGGKIEVLYSTRGADFSIPIPGTNETITREFRASYIDIPLLLTFNIIKPLAIEIGPQFSLLSSGETTGEEISVDQNNNITRTEVTRTYEPKNDPEIGLAVGLDLNLPKKLGVYARYNLGFNKVNDGARDVNYANSMIQLGIKYRFIEPI